MQIFRLPLLICVLCVGGLVAALLVEGSADLWASVGVAAPLILAGWFSFKTNQ
jgi:hypothetical protein